VADAEIGIGHVAGGLLVARRDQGDPVARVVQRIEQPDIAVPADAEHVRHLLVHEELGDQLSALHHRHALLRRVRRLNRARPDRYPSAVRRGVRASAKKAAAPETPPPV
jgi:hypothetical protein